MNFEKIILASSSPRRSLLLQWAEIPFEVVISDSDESYPEQLPPREIAEHIAFNKAFAVKEKRRNQGTGVRDIPILSADTIVVLNNGIIGKPATREEAIQTLFDLSGKKHSVITGVCILYGSKKIIFSEETMVEFNSLSGEQIAYYVDTCKPYDKAGAYAIQEWIGVIGVRSVCGDYYNVMGLPVNRVVKELESLG